MNPEYVKKQIINLLKASGKQFTDANGKDCTPEQFAEILLKIPQKEWVKYERKLTNKKSKLD